MTTGSDPYGTSLQSSTGVRFERVWSGADGRTETYGGEKRSKWNNYSCTTASRLRTEATVSYKKKSGASCGFSGVRTIVFQVPEPSLTLTWPASWELRLQSKLLQRVKSHDFNLGVNTAQVKQLTGMVDQNLRKLGRAALALKRGDFATAARQLGAKPKGTRLKPSDVSGRWLELQYGWLPAISDTFEAAKAFEAISNGPRSTTVRVSLTRKKTTTVTNTSNLARWELNEVYSKKIQYNMYEELSVARQLGLEDPASIVWEILPWSFVVDWFIPIGTYLENLNQIPKLRGRFLTTAFRKVTGFHGLRSTAPVDDCYYEIVHFPDPSTDRYSRIALDRTVSTTLTPPFPRFTGQGAIHGNRVWNAIALAQQAFTGVVTRRRR